MEDIENVISYYKLASNQKHAQVQFRLRLIYLTVRNEEYHQKKAI